VVVYGPSDAALVAAEIVAAIPAEQKRREAAARLQQNRLLASREDRGQTLEQGAREEGHALLVRTRGLSPQVDETDLGQRAPCHALRQPQQDDPAARGSVERLHGRRRGAEEQRGVVLPGAQRHDLARVVPWRS
jgi:hypothetical protein